MVLYNNRRALHEYEVIDTYLSGIVLTGAEVKSIKNINVSIADSYIVIDEDTNRVIIRNMYIAPNKFDVNYKTYSEKADRYLKLNRVEISKIAKGVDRKGYSIIPLEVLSIKGWIKIKIALCKGKKIYDKKKDLKERDIEKETNRILSQQH